LRKRLRGCDRGRQFARAYQEIVGAIQFKRFLGPFMILTEDGESSYDEPEDILAMRSVLHPMEGIRLLRMGEESFQFLNPDTKGSPKRWTRYGGEIHLWPTPNREYDIRTLYLREPVPLVESEDTTEVSNQWDAAIWNLASNQALLDLGDHHLANQFMQKAAMILRTRQTDQELDSESEGEGVMVAESFEDLQIMRRNIP
jgi:hypothetical protein